jgi:hypothetical protein
VELVPVPSQPQSETEEFWGWAGIQSTAAALEAEGLWTSLHHSDPGPYMPLNPSEAERAMRVRYFVYKVK